MIVRYALVALVTTSALASASQIVCKSDPFAVMSTLTDLRASEMYDCQESFISGEGLCYKGERTGAIRILRALSDNDVLGDEFRLKNVRASGRAAISYNVWDGPNESVVARAKIGPCL